MTDSPAPAPALARRQRMGGALWIAIAMGVMNLSTFVYTRATSQFLGPANFGAFQALMGVLLVVGVLSLGLQATGARRIASSPTHVEEIEDVILSVTYRSALVLALACLAATPVINSLLRLDSMPTAALVSVAAFATTVMGGQAGILQGEGRWVPLAWLFLASGLGRVVFGMVFIQISETEFSAIAGVAVGAFAPVAVGWLALRQPRQHARGADGTHPRLDLIREIALSSQALLAFFVLSNADIILARYVLNATPAGLYGAGLILVKIMLFLPQFVVVMAFPSMSRTGASRRPLVIGLAMVAVLGGCGVAATSLMPDLALKFVGNAAFSDVSPLLWLFAAVGTILSMVQLLIYSALARQQRGAGLILWTGVITLLALARSVDSVEGLVTLVVVLDLVIFAVLLTYALVRTNSPEDIEPAS